MSNRQQIDSVIDDDDEFWYGLPQAFDVRSTVLTTVKSPLYRRVRSIGQELQTMSLWVSGTF